MVELDGGQHDRGRRRERPSARPFLERRGFRVLRFWNNEVQGNLDGRAGKDRWCPARAITALTLPSLARRAPPSPAPARARVSTRHSSTLARLREREAAGATGEGSGLDGLAGANAHGRMASATASTALLIISSSMRPMQPMRKLSAFASFPG